MKHIKRNNSFYEHEEESTNPKNHSAFFKWLLIIHVYAIKIQDKINEVNHCTTQVFPLMILKLQQKEQEFH